VGLTSPKVIKFYKLVWMNTILLSLAVGLFSSTAFAAKTNVSTTLGLGYGKMLQEFGARTYEPQSVAGHIDAQFSLWKFVIGGSYMSVTNLNVGDERSYVGMGAVHAGLNLSNSVQVIGGVGAGAWRRRRTNQATVPNDYDYKTSGGGYMAGVRVFLINTKKFSVGLSGTYYHMKTDSFTSVEDNVKTNTIDNSRGTGTIAAIVFRFSGFDSKKLK
jgi:hypothetical protein